MAAFLNFLDFVKPAAFLARQQSAYAVRVSWSAYSIGICEEPPDWKPVASNAVYLSRASS